MFNRISEKFLSADGKSKVAFYIYEPKAPRAVIQLSHGMCEYVERYAKHAEYFCSQGFVFAGNDHLGHGNTAPNDGELGYIGCADFIVDDLSAMTDILRERYPDLPIFLLGHSMGSFALRNYMTVYGDKISGAIISGTAGAENPTGLGKLLATLLEKLRGGHYRSGLLFGMSNGGYHKAFGKGSPRECWLSRDTEVVEKYVSDKFCNYIFTVNGYRALFELLGHVSKRAWAKSVRRDLPVLMISGNDDPVGNFGKGVRKIYDRLVAAGLCDLSIKLWDGARHELFNELAKTREEVYKTVTDWINERI